MVARTGGRLLEPRAATTFAGTSIPVAVLPACRILPRNFMSLYLCRAGFRRIEGLRQTVVANCQLHDSNVIAERVAQPEVGAVEVLLRLRGDLDAARLERLVRLLAVIRGQAEGESGRALRDQLAGLGGGLLVHSRRARQLEQDIASGLSRHADSHPPHEPEIHVVGELHAKRLDIEIDGLVLVEDEDVGHVDRVVHDVFLPCVVVWIYTDARGRLNALASPKLLGLVHCMRKQVGSEMTSVRLRYSVGVIPRMS